MSISCRFAHMNVVARDWQRLAGFYEDVFGCTRLAPERDLFGPVFEGASGKLGAHARGVHLRVPGFGADGPTLEVFQYEPAEDGKAAAINRPGFSHIAFSVEDVEVGRLAVLAAGGGCVGEIAVVDIPGAGTVTLVYLTDPEGNIVELQKWVR